MRKIYKWDSDSQKLVELGDCQIKIRTYIYTDEMEPTRHPCDGKKYTSKARFREVTRAHGCVEVGNEYKNGYCPEKRLEAESKADVKRFREALERNLG